MQDGLGMERAEELAKQDFSSTSRGSSKAMENASATTQRAPQ